MQNTRTKEGVSRNTATVRQAWKLGTVGCSNRLGTVGCSNRPLAA